MTAHRSHATTTHRRLISYTSRQSHTPDTSTRAPAPEDKSDFSAFTAWPFTMVNGLYLFEKLMNSYRLPFVGWMDRKRPGSDNSLPQTEKQETDTHYFYRVALPGIAADLMSLQFENDSIVLTIEGSQKKRTKHYSTSHAYVIRRAFSLPVFTDSSAVSARLKNGILTITIPKTDKPVAPKSSNIAIH